MSAPDFLSRITVLVLTWNEEDNLARTLAGLRPFPRVVVLDSGSTDATLDIAASHPNVRLCNRRFDTHEAQWNHGLHHCGIDTEWVLALDADYQLSAEGVTEIAGLAPPPEVAGYRARFRYCVHGRLLKGSLYPPVTVLYRRERARYVQDGHTQRVLVDGEVQQLGQPIVHDDRKPLARWLAAQVAYARLEAGLLRSRPWRGLRLQDKLRRLLVVTPWLVPLYCLTVGRGALDGWQGLYYAIQRGVAEAILSLQLIELRARKGAGP